MTTATDDIAFLANSANRVSVMRLLAAAPRSHDEIRDEIGASRVTTARILREFEERDWLTRTGQECAITATGAWVCEAFTRLEEEMAAERRLRDLLQLFPADLLTFDVRHLRDAELVVREESDATAIIRRILEFRRGGDRIRGLTRTVAPVFIENDWELTVHGDTQLDMVITPEVLETVRAHPTAARQLREMLAEPDVFVSVAADVPISIGIVDGSVGIDLTDEAGVVRGGLVSGDETVYEWAVDLFQTCRSDATPLAPADLQPTDADGEAAESLPEEHQRRGGPVP